MVVSLIPLNLFAAWQTDGTAVCTAVGSQDFPIPVLDGAGGAVVAWHDTRGGLSDIYAQRLDASGGAQWQSGGVVVCDTVSHQMNPRAVSCGGSDAIIVWQDSRNGVHYDIYAQRLDGSGNAQWGKNGVAVCGAAGAQQRPRLVSDGAGGAIIVWEDYRSGSNYDVYAQRVDGSGNMQWAPDGVPVCAAAGDDHYPELTPDASHGAIVVWQDYRSGSQYDIYAQRVDGSGSVVWTVNGVAVCVLNYGQIWPRITSDGAGGAIVAWQDYRSTANNDVYAQRLDALGVPQWTANGVPISAAADHQVECAIYADGAGGAIIAWQDRRTGGVYDIYAQRVDASGTALWTANGAAVCQAANTQRYCQLTPDGAGGATIAWEDYRTGTNYDIYAQHVSATGTTSWTPDGVAVCAATLDQGNVQVASDGTAGALFVWSDARVVGRDVYAQRLNDSGQIVSVAPFAPELNACTLSQNAPNPFNPATKITFSLQGAARVRLCVYDIAGRLVRVLEEGVFGAGRHEAVWDGNDSSGDRVASGVYFCRLEAPDLRGAVESTKMVMIR
jgi:hypothetical protein